MSEPLVIGWRERAAFPEWNIGQTRVKMDTGARTSAINAIVREMKITNDGQRTVVLEIGLFRNKMPHQRLVEAPVVKTTRVRSSNGQIMERIVVETTIKLGKVVKRIQLSITDRHEMLVPIILGRTALAGDFLIDVNRKYVLSEC